jgi:hypothetical protein
MFQILLPIILIATSHMLADRFFSQVDGRIPFVACFTGIFFWPVLVWYAGWASYELMGDRVYGVSSLSTNVMQAYASYTTGSICVDVLSDSTDVLLFIHHFLTIVGMMYGVYIGKFHFYACIALFFEVSTPPLCCVLLLTRRSILERRFKNMLPEKSDVVCGSLLWITYLVFRVLFCPLLIILLLCDFVQFDLSFLCILCSLTVLFVLSCIWFSKIHAGLKKALSTMYIE